MQFRKYTKEQFINAVANSTSIAQVLKKLNVAPYGGNYKVAKDYIAKLNLNISHHTGQGWSKGKKFNQKRPIHYYLSNKTSIQSNKLKKRLINEGYFKNECSNCKNTKWLSKQIPLELHHIDGNCKNNNFSNLQILCPNCHALTPNYRGKNKSKHT